MSDGTESLTASRDAIDRLASLPIADLRRLTVQLDTEQRIVKSLLRERIRSLEQPRELSVVGDEP